MKKLEGIVPVMVSPLLSDGSADRESISRLVDHVVNNGCGGLWLLGSTGEDVNLAWDTRKQIIHYTASSNRGRVPLITGTGCASVSECLSFVDSITSDNIAGIHLLYQDHKQSDLSAVKQIQLFAEQSPYPIWLYHNPKRGKPLSEQMLRELREHEKIVGMKVGGYSLTEMINAVLLQRDDFQVIGAGGGQFFTMLSLGCSAHTASEACSRPAFFQGIYNSYVNGDICKAREQQFRLIEFNRSYLKTAFGDNGESSAEEKFILSTLGICQEFVNPAYRTLNNDEKKSILQAIKEYSLF